MPSFDNLFANNSFNKNEDDKVSLAEANGVIQEPTREVIGQEGVAVRVGSEKSLSDIEDELTQGLSIKDGASELMKKEQSMEAKPIPVNSMKSKLAAMFGDNVAEEIAYEADDHGNLIVGYEEKNINGEKMMVPIVQQRVFDIENFDLEIEKVSEEELRKSKTADELGLTPLQRAKYEKMMAMNIMDSGISHETVIQKAKSNTDLDSNIVPDMMVHFVTRKENEMVELTDVERNGIQKLREKGLAIEPEIVQGFNKSLKLLKKDKTIHARNAYVWMAQKGVDFNQLDEDVMKIYAEMYRKETRPSVDLLLEATLLDMQDVLEEKIRGSEEFESDKDALEKYINILRLNSEKRIAVIKLFDEKKQKEGSNEKFYSMDDFRKIRTYFIKYGLHEEDSKFFDPTFIPDPKARVPMKVKFDKFKAETGYNFLDVYSHYWEIVSNLLEKEGKPLAVGSNVPLDEIPTNGIQFESNDKNSQKDEIEDNDDDIEMDDDVIIG